MNCNHINQKKLAERWNISQRTLERWRAIGWGPLFLKIGNRVVYRVEDFLTYEE
ncbi:MAG: DNA-binding protein [Gammaproteobacteria bacterium]|nr:DNA-binding protein [Gammaproteobacteria bacterium]